MLIFWSARILKSFSALIEIEPEAYAIISPLAPTSTQPEPVEFTT